VKKEQEVTTVGLTASVSYLMMSNPFYFRGERFLKRVTISVKIIKKS